MLEKTPSQLANENFLKSGGVYQAASEKARMTAPQGYQEFPKMVRKHKGTRIVRGKDIDNNPTENEIDIWEDVEVNSEEEELRVRGGGKSADQVASDRDALILRAEQSGVRVDRRWSDERIRAEMAKVAA
jgi:hypothetical protein